MSKLPNQPGSKLSMDFYTFPNGAELLVVHDDFSRYPIVTPVKSTALRNVENELNIILETFGIPAVIRTDNGPPFNGKNGLPIPTRWVFDIGKSPTPGLKLTGKSPVPGPCW